MDDNLTSHVRIAVLQEQITGLKDAIVLQAKENERRLQELNHAHQAQIDRNAQYVSREAFELRTREIDKWRREVDMWRWISIGAGIAGGGAAAAVFKVLGVGN